MKLLMNGFQIFIFRGIGKESKGAYTGKPFGQDVAEKAADKREELSILVDTFCSRIRSKYASADQLAIWNC